SPHSATPLSPPMRNPFRFPDRRVDRGPDPGPFKDYKKYRPHLRLKFHSKCVYCRMPDTLGSAVYEIDHYRPRKQFPELVATWKNLFYACRKCNRRKSKFSPRLNLFIPNPCDHQMAVHLQFRGARIRANTDCGAFMIELLQLNEEKR